MTNTPKIRFGAVLTALIAAFGGMVAVASPASAATGGGCADPTVYFKYAIRACVGDIAGTASAYAYISLEAGHSPCTLALRIADDRNPRYVSPPVLATCPAGAVAHFDPFPTYAVSTHPGKWTAYVSITQTGATSPVAKSTSPPIIV